MKKYRIRKGSPAEVVIETAKVMTFGAVFTGLLVFGFYCEWGTV